MHIFLTKKISLKIFNDFKLSKCLLHVCKNKKLNKNFVSLCHVHKAKGDNACRSKIIIIIIVLLHNNSQIYNNNNYLISALY